MRLERLTRGHSVAAVAALVLLLVMAMDWYGSKEADAAREATSGLQTTGANAGEAARAAKADAQTIIARDEKNAWQEPRTLDRVLLVLLLLAVFVPLIAAALRAAGRRYEPPWTPSMFAALAAAGAAVILAYRIVNEPGNNAQTTLKLGVPLALLALVTIGLSSASAFQGEANWAQMRRTATQIEPEPGDDPGAVGESEPTDEPEAATDPLS